MGNKMRKLLSFFVAGLGLIAFAVPGAAYADDLHPWLGYGQVRESGGTVPYITAGAVGTCADGSMMLDVNGLVRCGSDTTTDPSDVIVRSGACYELDATCTAPDLLLAGGSDTKQYTGVTQANCGTDTITVTVVDNDGASTANALVEGTDWDCLTDDNTCATALAAAIDALTGVSAQSSTNTVGVRPDDSTLKVTLVSSDDPGCATASNGTDGVVGVPLGTKFVFDPDEDGDTYITGAATDNLVFYTNGVARFIMGNTISGVYDDYPVRFGNGSDCWLEHETATTPDQTEFECTDVDGGGTDGVVWYVPNGTDTFTLNTGVNLALGNAEFIHNDTDGKITLGGSGGTNNEDLVLDFETSANYVTLSSSTGVNLIATAGMDFRVGSANSFLFNGRTELFSDADGQLQIEQADNTVGVTLDANDAADTLTIKDQAGTGAGDLAIQNGSKGALTTHTGAVEDLACGASDASLTTSGLIPDGAILFGVTTRVTTALTGATGYTVGDGVDADLYAADPGAVTQGTTTDNSDATAQWGNPQLAAGEVTVTFTGANCTGGTVRVVAHYATVTAPTSN